MEEHKGILTLAPVSICAGAPAKTRRCGLDKCEAYDHTKDDVFGNIRQMAVLRTYTLTPPSPSAPSDVVLLFSMYLSHTTYAHIHIRQ